MSAPEITPEQAMDVLVGFLRDVREEKAYKVNEDGDYEDDAGEYHREPSPAPDIARGWCRELLTAADADGLGGCRLCCS